MCDKRAAGSLRILLGGFGHDARPGVGGDKGFEGGHGGIADDSQGLGKLSRILLVTGPEHEEVRLAITCSRTLAIEKIKQSGGRERFGVRSLVFEG